MKRLTKLPRTQYSGLEYTNLIQDIQQLVQESPDYNASWDNFTESNIGRVMIELFAWMGDQLATRIDWVANENFITTATQKKSIIRLLSLIGYKLMLPKAAMVEVDCVANSFFNKDGEYIQLTTEFNNDVAYKPFSLSGIDKNGVTKNFEILNYDEINKKFLYSNINLYSDPLSKQTLSQSLHFYEGTTKVEKFIVSTVDNQVFNLSYNPIIRNSVSVFLDGEELLLVPSFLSAEAQRVQNFDKTYNAIPYTVKTTETNSLIIEFGPISILPDEDRRPSIGDVVYVVYRVGGGESGNITVNSINATKNLTTTLGNSVIFSFSNSKRGVGGEESESLESALFNGPLSIRTAQKTVTKEDYEIILNEFENILKAKSYGADNIDTDYYNKYKVDLNPYEVWNFVCLEKPGWEDVSTRNYNDFNWIDLKLENRFNELVSFRDGEFNYLINFLNYSITRNGNLTVNDNLETFTNYIFLTPSDAFIENLTTVVGGVAQLNTNYKIIPYNKETELIYFDKLTENTETGNWYLNSVGGETKNIINTSSNVSYKNYKITEECSAEIFGNLQLTTFTATTGKQFFNISIDGRKTVKIELESDVKYSLNETNILPGIIETFNDTIALSYHGLDEFSELIPYAYGYHNIGIQKTVNGNKAGISSLVDEEEVGEKVTANYLEALNSGTGPTTNQLFYLRFKVKTENATTIYNKSFTLENETPTSEIVSIVIISSNVNNYVGKYFILYNRRTPYLVWFNTGADSKPVVVGFTTAADIEINISGAVGLDGIGIAISDALTTTEFTGAYDNDTDTVDITVNQEGICVAANSGNMLLVTAVASTFEVSQTGKGEGVTEYPITGDFNISSYEDVTQILNRRLQFTFGFDIEAVLDTFEQDEEEVGSCYDIRFKPLDGSDILGVEILEDITGNYDRDIIYLLTEGRFPLTRNRPYGDYRNVFSKTQIVSNGITTSYLKLTSPNTGKDSTLTIKPVGLDSLFSSLTSIDHLVVSQVRQNIVCYGYRKLSLVTNQLNENFGKLLLELNIPKIPFYYEKANIYLNYVSNEKDTIELGDTNLYKNSTTLNYIYNTVIKSGTLKEIDVLNTDYILKFTKEQVESNSLFAIDNEIGIVPKKNIVLTTAANSANIVERILDCPLKSLSLSVDFEDNTEATEKKLIIDLSSCNGETEIITLTITSECVQTGTIILKLRGVSVEVSVTQDWTIQQIVNAIYAETFTDWDKALDDLDEDTFNDSIIFTAKVAGKKTGNNALYVINDDIDTGIQGTITVNTEGVDATMENIYQAIFDEFTAQMSTYLLSASNFVTMNQDGSINIMGAVNTDSAQIRLFFTQIKTGEAYDASTVTLFGEYVNGSFTGNFGSSGDYTIVGSFPITSGNYFDAYSNGDFSIVKEDGILKMIKSANSTLVPDINFYIHYINDRRYNRDINDSLEIIDEDTIKDYLNTYKILGIENTIKQPYFINFDIEGTVYCNSLYTTETIRSNVETILRENYNITNSDFAKSVTKSDIFNLIQSVNGVQYSEITYLGKDATDTSTKVENTLEIGFDEIAVLSDDVFNTENSKIHGILLSYSVVS